MKIQKFMKVNVYNEVWVLTFGSWLRGNRHCVVDQIFNELSLEFWQKKRKDIRLDFLWIFWIYRLSDVLENFTYFALQKFLDWIFNSFKNRLEIFKLISSLKIFIKLLMKNSTLQFAQNRKYLRRKKWLKFFN